MDDEATRANLDAALRRVDLSWEAIEATASEVVLFGSRAAGVSRQDSDWDVLLIGDGRPLHTKQIDLIWLAPSRLASADWLGSELASHVAAHGRWLLGSGDWRHQVHVSTEAAARKRAAISIQLATLQKVWPDLLPGARARHVRRLRRDVQRWHLLHARRAVPPTYRLDQAWSDSGMPHEDLEALIDEVHCLDCDR